MSGPWPSGPASPRSAPRGVVDPGRGSSPPGGRPWRPPGVLVVGGIGGVAGEDPGGGVGVAHLGTDTGVRGIPALYTTWKEGHWGGL